MSTGKKSDFELPTNMLDDLFSTQEMRDDAKLERIHMIPLCELHAFKDHPFKINNDEEMERMCESIQKVGTITPALARPMADGGYEIVSGHRRLAACQQLGIEKMPVIVRDMTDDEAIIAMVDANLQRERILPSEKAFAFKMKVEALNHQGTTSVQLGQKSSRSIVANDAGTSETQIQRYIRLTNLIPEILVLVDDGKMAFNPAVEISYLTQSEQHILLDVMEQNDCTPSHSQSIRLKKLSLDGLLSDYVIREIVSEEKPNQQDQFKFKREDIRKYFPSKYTDEQVYNTVIKLLEKWKRSRDRDAR